MKIKETFVYISLIFEVCHVVCSFDENIAQNLEAFEFAFSAKINNTNNNEIDKLDISNVLIVIRSQHNKYHREKANELKAHLLRQAHEISDAQGSLHVLMTHESWAPYGSWTILPIINKLNMEYLSNKKWVFFCEESTEVNLVQLFQVLSHYPSNKEVFLGHALTDTEPAIIHHFAFFQDVSVFSFPDFAAGWAMSASLCRWLDAKLQNEPPTMDFSIDVQHEVAMQIYNSNKGFNLTNVREFCINENLDPNRDESSTSCATNVNEAAPDCGSAVDAEDIFIGVKTCKKYHAERMPFVLQTIGRDAKHIVYYSDTEDATIPTEYAGVANTESGHCTKLYNILKEAYESENHKSKPWIVIIDDDTIMRFSRLQKLLACYDPKDPILLGERYGYGVNYETHGYEYITGGGGMILSRTGLDKLISSECRCASDDSPDDMWLGMCFRNMGIPSVHNSAFHQARPSQYVPELLQHQYKVSFHKHFMVDPMDVYKKYLHDNSTDSS
eukprot:gene14191-15671_t